MKHPDDRLLKLMKRGVPNIMHNNQTYHLLGRGGEGNVYEYNNRAIKVYHDRHNTYNPDAVYYEIYIVRFLTDLGLQVAPMYDFNSNSGYVYSDLYDGDLDTWTKNACNVQTSASEDQWLSMIFQVAYTFMMMNMHNVLHNDPKPKNVFYVESKDTKSYALGDMVFNVPHNGWAFYVGDFSRALIVGYDDDVQNELQTGSSSTGDLYTDLQTKTDLYELSRILYRVMVNAIVKNYSMTEINDLVHQNMSDPIFKERIETVVKDITSNIHNHRLAQTTINRAHVYELLESGYIDPDKLQKRIPDLVLPSKKVRDILMSIQVVPLESLFSFYV